MFITKRGKRAQVGIEILFAIGITMLIFLVMIPITINKKSEVTESAELLEQHNDCRNFVNIVARVSSTLHLNVTHEFENGVRIDPVLKTITVGEVLCSSVVEFNLDEALVLDKGKVNFLNDNEELKIKNVENA